MQTFLPFPDFERSLRSLDHRRLGKQRVECLQVVRGLTVEGYGWARHPAVLMWRGHLEALGCYSLLCCAIWVELGHIDTCAASITAELASVGVTQVRPQAGLAAAGALPYWLGDVDLHRSHRAALLRKDPGHYRPLFADADDLPDVLPYVWPAPGGAPAE